MQRCADGVRDKERDQKKKDTHGYAQAEGENSQRQKHSLTKRWLERDREKREKHHTSIYLKNNVVMKRGFKKR